MKRTHLLVFLGIIVFFAALAGCKNNSATSPAPALTATPVNQFSLIVTSTPTQDLTVTATNTPFVYPTYTPVVTQGWELTGFWHSMLDNACPDFAGRTCTSLSNVTFAYNLIETGMYETGDENEGTLITPYIQVGTGKSLVFSSYSETECAVGEDDCDFDHKEVYISIDNGTTWEKLTALADADAWDMIVVPLTGYDNTSARFKFYFHTIDEESNAYAGWYVDDVRVETVAP